VLGSLTESDDAVQDAWLRADTDFVVGPISWSAAQAFRSCGEWAWWSAQRRSESVVPPACPAAGLRPTGQHDSQL